MKIFHFLVKIAIFRVFLLFLGDLPHALWMKSKTWRGQKLSTQISQKKCCQHLELLIYFEKEFRSLYTSNKGSVGQRTEDLLGVEFGVLKKKSDASAITAKVCASAFCPGLSLPALESLSKFDGRQLYSLLTYRPHTIITCIERSKALLNVCQKFKRLPLF